MDTAQEITQRLRRELGYPRIFAAADASADRWCVYEVLRRVSGGWDVPFSLSETGEVLPGVSSVREVRDTPTLIYVHERPGGGYAEPNVHLMLEALRKQDRWRARDIAGDMVRRIQANRVKQAEKDRQMFADLSMEARPMFAKAADEMGL
jgi:hypothetical protein